MRRLVALALLLIVPALLAGRARAGEDGEPVREAWRFRKGDHVRTVDVTGLEDAVREAVVRRLAADGYERVEDDAGGHAWGRDLRADVEELVRGGGRFPTPAAPAGRFLGAFLAWEPGPGRGLRPRIEAAPPGSLAAALGLGPGDRLLTVDGREADPEAVRERVGVELEPGQLRLGILRRDGRTETLRLEFRRGPAPRGAARVPSSR